ncbi:16S rRNA (cytosine(1402)-N(4))-methyltransferase RsmH [Erysipelothrix urinaevulpis]|uniref:16S rRNA (cytosine(1402)-N(4))-methyltransferase RsmH n=1 Tax=Erysipelothrix urinaevulpis TaxID=2683717 RepID=UPI00135C8F2D|nr:16S rRNA (cytosine(1402)-N(4))-methyltransferase RsmH [Erysipelothrix urinaevulpis]
MKHYSVMLNETIESLNIKEDGVYIDATLGAGGHTEQILKRLTTGHVIGFDKDADALKRTHERLKPYGNLFESVRGSYTQIEEVLAEKKISEVDGIIFDLGVSSPQFDDPSRGFSYRFDERLDMRMDQRQKLSAYEVVNTYSESDLERILKDYGEERFAKGIARQICLARPLETTFDLVEAVKRAYPFKEMKKGHPAKQTFQAIRIEVNNELGEVEDAIEQAINSIKVGGRVVVLTFHSLEDRLVKKAFNKVGKPAKVNPRIPVAIEEELNYKVIVKGKKASKEELKENNRSHSAILRVLERVR